MERVESGTTYTGTEGLPRVDPGWLARLSPGWFGAVMGTGIIAVIAAEDPGHIASLNASMRDTAYAVAALAALLAVLLIVPYLLRWIIYPARSWASLKDPQSGPLHGTVPGGVLVLSVVAAAVGPRVLSSSATATLIEVLDGIGIPLALVISILFAYLLFTLDHHDRQEVNGGWFIPPVVTIIVPVVLVPLMRLVGASGARLLLFTSYSFLGVGLILFVLVLAMLHDRMVTQPLPAATMAPSLWIVLGPAGVGAAALLDLAHVARMVLGPAAQAIGPLSMIGATLLWGFGGWSLLVALALLGRYLRQGGIPYGVGWWGFTFPVGALTVATVSLGKIWTLPIIGDVAFALFVLLVVLWLGVSASTLGSLLGGRRQLPATIAAPSSTK
ncbi:MAG: hypothetical protein ACP5HZ_00505 [Ferrimicrobium sp.]